ncbi:MAG: aminodeoxychorismate synthase component I [Alphaproteobacteria bacterium]|nr:aminodeoxychorismate synthase component I [Alphaproteobacteria bacterium]
MNQGFPRSTVLLDDATPGRERLWRFAGNCGVIRADALNDVPGAFARMEMERRRGRFVAGYFSYELGHLLEPKLNSLLPERRDVPLLWFGVFERMEEGRLEPAGRAYTGPLRHEWDAYGYHARFKRVRDYIAAGDIYQANLSFRSRFAFAGDPRGLYASLRARSNAAYGAYIDDGERQILSLSPELFFDLAADGHIAAKPMKGTIARGADPASDDAARARLAASEKDRAENLMIVDLLRNDLGRVAELGSVSVADLFAVETYPTLHTMVSTVKARLKQDVGIEGLVRAIFPCGSVTGAPKIRAMQIIRELEESPRGLYCGAIGYFAPDGAAKFNVAIRTLTISGAEGRLGIGGAVVQDSTAQSEFDECLLKARYYEAARRPLELIETLASDGGRLERHLERMARSAAFFGIAFDRARLVLPDRAEPSRLRIALDESGAFHCAAVPLEPAPARWTFAISPRRVLSDDPLARHKTSWREHLEPLPGADETVFLNERGEVAEGSRSTVFVKRGGVLLTPPLSAGVLDGVLRRELLDEGRAREATLMPRDLGKAEVLLGNSLRGLIAAVPVLETV